MTLTAPIDDNLRQQIISRPSVILDDQDVMRALIAANESSMGGNIVDLRGIALARLESRLDKLEDTHRSVIAAAYENVAGTNQIHRAVLRLMEPASFAEVVADLHGAVAEILRVDTVRLIVEPGGDALPEGQAGGQPEGLTRAEPGTIQAYLGAQGAGPGSAEVRRVTLRQLATGHPEFHGDRADDIRSEACLVLDLGARREAGLLVLGSEDAQMFTPQQGGDLLGFFAGVCGRILRRHLG